MCQYQGRVLSCEEIYEVLRCAKCTRLAVCGNNRPYIVPMNYTWDCVNGRLHFYLTSCDGGEKVRSLRRNNRVALEFEVPGNNNCMCTVVARGTVVSMGNVGGANDNDCDCGCGCGHHHHGRGCGCGNNSNSCNCGCGNNGNSCNCGCGHHNNNCGCGCGNQNNNWGCGNNNSNNGCNCFCCRCGNGCICCCCCNGNVGGESDDGRLCIEIRVDSITGRAFSGCCNG